MSRYLDKPYEAVARLVARLTICSEAREAFTADKFDATLEHYFAKKAISAEHRTKLKELMRDGRSVEAMRTINQRLHDLNLKPPAGTDRCWWDVGRKKPYVFYRNLISSLVVIVSSLWLWLDVGFHPAIALSTTAGLWVLWYALRYDWL